MSKSANHSFQRTIKKLHFLPSAKFARYRESPHAEDKRDSLVDRAVFEVLSLRLSGPERAPAVKPITIGAHTNKECPDGLVRLITVCDLRSEEPA